MQVIKLTFFLSKTGILLPSSPLILIAYSRNMFKNDKRHFSQCRLRPLTSWGTCVNLFVCFCLHVSFPPLLSAVSYTAPTVIAVLLISLITFCSYVFKAQIIVDFCNSSTSQASTQLKNKIGGRIENDGHTMK